MTDLFYSFDINFFYAINHGLANPVFDFLMPLLTDLNKFLLVRILVALILLLLLVKGGNLGRSAVLMLIVTIIFSDQFNSTVLKHLIERLRPCHELPDVHLLVSCGSGLSFPSSHAVNNFAGAILLSFFYPKARLGLFSFASLVAFSRVYVGVHYPSDVIAGGIIGLCCGGFMIVLFSSLQSFWLKRKALASHNQNKTTH
ncbi:MAG: phosphatase PAP2 family protein [bacterium]